MSLLRKKLANDDLNKIEEQDVQPTNVELEQPAEVEQPIEQEVKQEEPVQQPTQETTEQPNQESGQEKSNESVLKDYPNGYTNQFGKVTPYHILFKDSGTKISNMNGNQALDFTLNKINELNKKYNGDPDYMNPSPDAIAKFKKSCSDAKTGMDVMFELKDFLLASEGQTNTATIKDAFENPRIAKRIASIFNTLIECHESLKKVSSIKICPQCGDNFEPKSGETFCSKECEDNYKEENQNVEDFIKTESNKKTADNKNFTTLKEIGDYVEELDMTVEDNYKDMFDEIISRYLDKVDPNNELAITDAVQKLSLNTAKQMVDELLELYYKED